MDTRQAYNTWAAQYDTNQNKTRDLEGVALRAALEEIPFKKVLEIGCGTGKNTAWLLQKANHVTAVDFSEEMLDLAKTKITSGKVNFVHADITEDWTFGSSQFDLVSFSLVLEHIEHLDRIFKKVNDVLAPGGFVYIGELHPYKQYTGTKARFDTEEGRHVVPCFNHHVSDFVQGAKQYGLELLDVNEHFDDNDRSSIPRILTILLHKAK